MRSLATVLAAMFATPLVAQTSEAPLEQISIWTSIGILFFLLLAALIVISILCQLLIVIGLVPGKGKVRSVMFWLARVVSNVQTTSKRDTSSSSGGKGGGGSFGGGGSSGNW
jgi:uncharacterized membrane protein YgcG